MGNRFLVIMKSKGYWVGGEGLEKAAEICEGFVEKYKKTPTHKEFKVLAKGVGFLRAIERKKYEKFGITSYTDFCKFLECYYGLESKEYEATYQTPEKIRKKATNEEKTKLHTKLAQLLLEGIEPSEEDKKRMRDLGIIK